MSHKGKGPDQKEQETSFGGEEASTVVHEVGEVYVYIPPELSAAGVELKIVGSVRVINKGGQFYLTWSPSDLSHQDVASLYLAQADGWTMVDQFVEPPEVIEARELSYPDRQYCVGNLDAPEPILMSPVESKAEGKSPATPQSSEVCSTAEIVETDMNGAGVRFARDGEAHISGVISQNQSRLPSQSSEKPKADSVNFPLSQLHSIREAAVPQSPGKRSLTFFLLEGTELPTLYFHDGGILGLLNTLQRYVYLIRDRHDNNLYRVKEFDKKKEKPRRLTQPNSTSPQKKGAIEDIFHGAVHGVIGGAMGNIIGITRAVRQHLIPDTKLQEVRPGTEGDDDFEEKIQTVAILDASEAGQRGNGERREKGALKPDKPSDPEMSLITDFQVITDIRGKLPPRLPPLPVQSPVTLREWETFRDGEGRIRRDQEMRFRARVFGGGIDPSIRKETWRYLLNYFPFDMTDIDRMELQRRKEQEYWSMKTQWQTFTVEQEKRFSKWREVKTLINKDVLRTDRDVEMFRDKNTHRLTQLEEILRTYVMYNFDLGYVQGMSDLLAPLLCVMDNEVDTFWCFAGFMEMVGHHFEVSQMGMRNRLKQLRAVLNVSDPQFYQFLRDKECNNLYFCFRWLLIHFKREFDYPRLMRLWEVIWTNYLSPDYSLFIALAILEREKMALFQPTNDFSDILEHINGLSKKIPLEPTLQLAEVLCRQLGSCRDLPDDLKCLVVRPAPKRLETIVETETIVCSPEGSAVPSKGEEPVPSREADSLNSTSSDSLVV